MTHVVTESGSLQQVIRCLDLQSEADLSDLDTVTLTWLTDSLKAGVPVKVEARHRVSQDTDQVNYCLPCFKYCNSSFLWPCLMF